jgi:hypothetical protein
MPQDALHLETYIQDADRDGDAELTEFSGARRQRAAKAPNRASNCCGLASAGSTPTPTTDRADAVGTRFVSRGATDRIPPACQTIAG